MRIDSVEIVNYRQYKNLSFSFSKLYNKNHDLHVIIARNGVGKSNFLNAITWCLYGKETHLQDSSKSLPVPNMDTISKTLEKKPITVSVTLKVECDGEIKTITREAVYIKNQVGDQKVFKKSEVVSITQKAYDEKYGYSKYQTIEGDTAVILIGRIFPEGINQYFFFDNEQMNNYFTRNDGIAIRKSINEISKVTVIQNTISKLNNIQNEYRVNLSSGNSKIKRLQEDLELKKDKLQRDKEELDNTINQINLADKRIAELKNEIGAANNLKELEKQRDILLKKKEDLKKRSINQKKELNEFIVRYSTLIHMYPSFIKTLKLIEEKDKQRQLPPEINPEVMRKSISKCECELCKNKLDEKHIKIIQEKLELFDISSPVYSLLLGIKYKVKELKDETEKYPLKKEELLKNRNILLNEIEENENALSDVLNQMKLVANADEIMKKIEEREMLEQQLRRLLESKGNLQNRIFDMNKKVNDIEEDIEREIRKQEKDNEKARLSTITSELKKIAQRVEKEIVDSIRNEICETTFENFKRLIWKDNTYQKIVIDEEYNVDLIHKRGYSAIGSTSAAERALLALSFTTAIHSVSGFESPLVIDSPVGRVSDENRRRFSETLAEISRSKQIIMLFTPDEYSKDVSDVFDGIATKSQALMDEGEEITEIKGVQ